MNKPGRPKAVEIDKTKVRLALLNADPVITQKELAEKIDMTPQALSNALRAGKMSQLMLQRIADVLERPASSFLADPPERKYRNNVMKEGSPRAFVIDDQKLFFYTSDNKYASLEKIISMACALGFRDQIQEILNRQ